MSSVKNISNCAWCHQSDKVAKKKCSSKTCHFAQEVLFCSNKCLIQHLKHKHSFQCIRCCENVTADKVQQCNRCNQVLLYCSQHQSESQAHIHKHAMKRPSSIHSVKRPSIVVSGPKLASPSSISHAIFAPSNPVSPLPSTFTFDSATCPIISREVASSVPPQVHNKEELTEMKESGMSKEMSGFRLVDLDKSGEPVEKEEDSKKA